MVFGLRSDEDIAMGLKRIALQQIDRAIHAFRDRQLAPGEAVHQARQRCKKIRALLRLLEGSNVEWSKRENACFREAAAKLSHTRDADVMLETYENVKQFAAATCSRRVLEAIDHVFAQRGQTVVDQQSQQASQIEDFILAMQAARTRVVSWPNMPGGVAELQTGYAKTNRRGRRAMKASRRLYSDEAFHDWRKWAKYQFYQTRLLNNFLKDSGQKRAAALQRLSNLLGVDHDLAVLRHEVLEASDFSAVRELSQVGGMLQAIDRQRRQLQTRSIKVGKRVYAKRGPIADFR